MSWTKILRLKAVPSAGIVAPPEPLTAMHLCDRCGAQAHVRILLPSLRDLLFCTHHHAQHAPALAKMAVEIQDDTKRLLLTR